MAVSTPPAFSPTQPPIPLGAVGTVLQVTAPGVAGFAAGGGGGGGVGGSLAFAPAAGVIDPAIVGFVAAAGTAGTGRLKVTLTGNTSFEGLPAGADGQQLFITVVAGAFLLTLLHLNGSTAQAKMSASSDTLVQLRDTVQLLYDVGLGQWLIVQ